MAGSFPDVPGPRMSYDKDGSIGIIYNNIDDEFVRVNNLDFAQLNSEDNTEAFVINSQPTASEFYLGILFPEARKIDGIFVDAVAPVLGAADQFMDITLEYSTNTANFYDGTWTTVSTSLPFSTQPKLNYRTNINPLSIASAVAIRIVDRANSGNTGKIKNLHLYGSIIEDSTRLAFWHPTLDEPLPGYWLDFGNVKQSTYAVKQFRIKNLSTSDTATNIRISPEALTDTLPTNVSQHALSYPSYNTGAYDNPIYIASLAPSTISDLINIKRTTLSNAILSAWTIRLFADVVGGWA